MAEGLARQDLVVAYDLFLNDTARRFADVVLPATAWLEEIGCKSTNTHLYLMPRMLEPPGEARSAIWVMRELARRLGLADFYPWTEETGALDAILDHPATGHASAAALAVASPILLGKFWTGALGWPDEPIDEGFIQQLLDAGMDERETESFYVTRETPTSRPRFLFQRRERSRPDSYPIHLDFLADDREAELERLTGLGARVEETKSDDERTWTVMRDPESNPFCVE